MLAERKEPIEQGLEMQKDYNTENIMGLNKKTTYFTRTNET